MAARNHILGVGTCLPDNIVTNDDLSERMDTSHEWIEQRTGICERRHVAEDCASTDLGKVAAEKALKDAGLTIDDIDLLIYATLSPDLEWPATACMMAAKLGARPMPALDVRNQCSGFVYALATADTWLKSGRGKHVLIVGGEIHSTGLDISTRGREVSVIFGDAAAAVVLGPSPDGEKGILSTHLHADGKFAEKLWLEVPTSRRSPTVRVEDLEGEDPSAYPRMAGRYVFKHAVTRFPEVIRESLAANGYGIEDLDLLVPHQANLRINQFVGAELKLEEARVVNNMQKYGNTTAASIPLALREALDDGRAKEGGLICLAAFGAGFTWAAALVRW
ncbi:MAG: beta-ketoacyl-ACP synthase III [Deltaproteobacteria bacterium]